MRALACTGPPRGPDRATGALHRPPVTRSSGERPLHLTVLPTPVREAAGTTLPGTVLRARSGFYTVRLDDGTLLECRLRGRVKQERGDSDLVVIGDRVNVAPRTDGEAMIESIEPRRTRFSRRQPGPRGSWKE